LKKIDRIIEYIENHGLSVSDFERRAGLGPTYLSSTKKRDADISQKSLIKIKENLKGEYYKIFPEELGKGAYDENHETSVVNEPLPDLEKLKTENELLKTLIESKQSEIESLKMVIEVLREKDNVGGKSQEGRKHSA
jgi:hypothetical protein